WVTKLRSAQTCRAPAWAGENADDLAGRVAAREQEHEWARVAHRGRCPRVSAHRPDRSSILRPRKLTCRERNPWIQSCGRAPIVEVREQRVPEAMGLNVCNRALV